MSLDLSWVAFVRQMRVAIVVLSHCRNGAALWRGKRNLAAQDGGLAAKPQRHLESTLNRKCIQRAKWSDQRQRDSGDAGKIALQAIGALPAQQRA